MISILFLLHVTLLLWALSGSRLILCLKPVGITWSPEQNDSLQVWSLLAVVKRYSLGRDTWELWCLGAAAQPGGGGSWKVPTSQARWSGMGQGVCGTFLYQDRMTTELCEGLGSCCRAAPPRDASLPASCPAWSTQTVPSRGACVAVARAAHVLLKWITLGTKLHKKTYFFFFSVQKHKSMLFFHEQFRIFAFENVACGSLT